MKRVLIELRRKPMEEQSLDWLIKQLNIPNNPIDLDRNVLLSLLEQARAKIEMLTENNYNLILYNDKLRRYVDTDFGELTQAKRLLKDAVKDFDRMYERAKGNCILQSINCNTCPFRVHDMSSSCGVWWHKEEAMELIGND